MEVKTMTAIAALAAGTVLAMTGLSAAEAVYADGRGNLVIQSDAGYKQIFVGKGHMAEEVLARAAAENPGKPWVMGDPTSQHKHPKAAYRCSGGAAVYRGRSFMYGLTRDEVAVLDNECNVRR